MENGKKEIAEFYKQIFSDIKLKEKIVEKAKAIANEEDLKKLIQQEIVPLMKKFNVNFSEEELLSYEQETLKKLSEEALESVSGGVSIKSALLTGGLLSMALLGGVGLNSSIASAMDNEPPSPPGEERRVKSSNNAKSRSTQNSNLQQFNNILSPLRENLDEVQQKALDKAMSEHGHVGTDGKNIFIYEKTARPNAVILSRILTPNNDNDTVLEIPESMVTPRGKVDAVGLGEWFLLDSKSLGANVSKFKKITLNPNISKFEFGRFSAAGTESGVNIEEINFGNAKQIEIGENAFSYLQSLKSAIFSNDVEKIILGKHAFLGSHNFETFNLPHCNYMIIESEIFGDSKIKEINIEANELKVKDLDVPYNYKGIHYDAYENFDNTKTLKDNNDDSSSDNNGNSHIDDIDNNNNDNIENDDNDNDNANDNNNTDNAQQNDIKNGVKSYLERAENQNLENQNLIDESRENDYEQAKNENRIAIGGGHIFSYTLASSGNGVILTDIYTKVVDGILVIPPEVTTQDGHVRPVVGIRGEKFRTSKIKVVKLGPLTEIFFFEGDAESAFFGNKNIEKVDCSEAAKLKYLEIGDSAFEDSSLKSIVAPPQEVKIVTGVNAYAWAPIEDYVSYLLSLDSQKTSGFWGFFKKASDTIIDKANHVLNKLKSIINLSCLNNSFMISELKDDLNSVVGAIGSSELDSLEQSDCDLLLNAATLFELGDYDSQINVKPSKIGNNNNDSNNSNDDDNNNNDNGDFSDNDNDNNTGGDDNSGDDNNNNNNNDNDDNNGDFNDHSGNNNDNDNDDDHNNSQGPEEFVNTNENSEQQSDNESQEIQAETQVEVTDDDDDKSHKKISVDEFLARGSLSLNNKDDAEFVEKFIKQNPVEDLENKINRETAQEIVGILGSFIENDYGATLLPTQVKAGNYGRALISKFGGSIAESDEKNDNFSGSDDNRNDKDNSSDSSKHDDNDNDDDNDDDDTPKKLKTKKIKINSNKKRISSKTKSKTSAKTGKKKINAKNSDIDLKNADNGNSQEPEVEAMPEESNNNALKQEVVAEKEESNNNNANANNSQESKAEVATEKNSNDNDNANSIDHGKIIQQGDCGANGGNVKFAKYEDGHLDISGQGAMKNYGHKYVKDIAFTLAPWGTDIKSVTIGPSVTSVGDSALCGCSNLTEVHVSDTVKSIGEHAFADTGLTSFDIPRSVTSIGSFAFSSSQLESIFIPNNVKKLDTYVFSNCNKLETVTVEEGIDGFSYADEMFRGCASLKTVNLPNSFEEGLSNGMFADCTSLEEITLTASYIPVRTFSGCTALKKVNDPRLHEVRYCAFQGCKNLTNISFADTLGNSEIGNNAFDGCQKLTNVNLGKVKKIKDSAFKNCTSLEKIVIPSRLTNIGNNAFDGCENLTDVTYEGMPNPVNGKLGVFRNCEKLKRIKLTSNWKGGNDFCGYPVVGNEVIVNDNDESLNKSKPNKKVKIRRGKKKAKRKTVNKNIETSTDDDYDDE